MFVCYLARKIIIVDAFLYVGLKRVSLTKDPLKGIGCTIKSAAGHVFVNAIVEDGPIAFTGALRPGITTCREIGI